MSQSALALLRDAREMFAEQVEYRELLAQMVRRDLLLRYKQTIMGIGWAVFMPLVNTAVFSVIFVRVAPLSTEVPYPVFAFCGLLAWNFFASALRFAVVSLTSNTNLVTKVYFPREIFPFSCVVVALVDFAVGSVVLIALMVYYDVGVSTTLWLLPLVVVVHVAFTAGVALLVAMANLFYRDVKYLFEVALSIWMFSSSVVYPVGLIGGKLGRVLALNPMTPILDAYRDVILLGREPFTPVFLAAAVISLLTLIAGWLLFHRAEFRFAESI
jgi:homopolymeric O-antigen transport system permease protein